MIKKIINLGFEVPETGEVRVQLLDQDLVKTASNEIQEYWIKLEKCPDKAYIHVIAMTDSTRYGCNNNGDYFYGDDLREYHPNFVKNAHIYLHHVNKDPKKSIGKPVYSFYNENLHRVELGLEIVKKNLKRGLFISTPLLFAFMVLVSSLSAIDYTSAQLVETAVNEKPDLIVKINNFSNYSVSNRFKADMWLNDKVEKATLFYSDSLSIILFM